MCRSTSHSAQTVLLVSLLGLLALLQSGIAARDCASTSTHRSPHLTETSLDVYTSCANVTGDLILGLADCSSPCTVTSLDRLAHLQYVSGSLVIQCCPDLEQISGLSELTSIAGTLRIYYNEQIHKIEGFGALGSVGNLEISQNGNLTRIDGFSSLKLVEGYLQIDHNQKLLNLDGLSGVREIGGSDLVAGHALSVLYNPALLDLRWLRNLTLIGFGTVHIEGNLLLCYAGYPQWAVGGFNARPPSGDKGIDWRTLLDVRVPTWQYSWGVEEGGYPTLVIQNNAAYEECDAVLCHTSCIEGAGCLGPLDPSLCGTCLEGSCEIGATPTSVSCDRMSVPYWPPTKMPYSLLFGFLFGIGGLLLVALVLLGGWVMYRVCRKLRAGRKGNFDINEGLHTGGVELIPREACSGFPGEPSSSRISSIIAQSSESKRENTASAEQRGESVVLTSSRYKSVSPTPPSVDTASTNTSLPSTSGISSNITTNTVTSSVASASPVHREARQPDLRGSLHSIPEEIEDEMNAAVQRMPVRRLYKQDTLTRLQKGNSVHVAHFPRSHLRLKKEIGSGEFGRVFYGECKKLVSGEKKTPVIVKQLKENSNKQEQENFLRPVEAMSLLQHPNVLSLMGACVDGEPIVIFMEYCAHGNLKTYLVRKRREAAAFRESGKLVTIACHMAAGLTYLHSNNVAHNDFAVRNCLVSGNETVKLGDYGLTKHIFKEDYYSRGGRQKAWPVRWMAPEQLIVRRKVLDSQPASTAGNVWSFGISLWEVSTFAQWPYYDLSNEEVIDTVQSSQQCVLENPFQPSDMLSSLYDVMQLCWKPANERPPMADILSQLEEVRDDIARNTPSTSSRRKKITSSHSPKPTSTAPRPKQATSEKQTPTVTSVASAKRCRGANHKPRRPPPKVPEEGSLKRGTTMQPPVSNTAHHSLQKSTKTFEKTQEPHQIKHKITGAGVLEVNPLFEEMEQLEKENEATITGVEERAPQRGRLQEGGDSVEGVLFVNHSAEEEDEEDEEVEGGEREGVGRMDIVDAEAEEDGWVEDEDDFILEPPEDFSQISVEREDLHTNAASHPSYDPSESHYTSIDDFDASVEEPPQEPAPEEQWRADSFTIPMASHAYAATHINVDTRETRKQWNGSRSSASRKTGDDFSVPPLSYRSVRGHSAKEAAAVGKKGGKKTELAGTYEPDFDNLDSRYRRPTSRISGLLKRAPSWGRSGKNGTSGDDDIPNVVYDDEVSALIW